VVREEPVPEAIDRIDQGVASVGLVRKVRHDSNVVVVDGSRSARATLVEQAITAILQKSAHALASGVFVKAKCESNRQTLSSREIRAIISNETNFRSE
jgi:hypothetical protein